MEIDMKQISILAPAKINLYLNVAGKRADGYHDIESVMQSVSLFDRLDVAAKDIAEGKSITLTSRGISIPTGENNLICRAAKAFFEAVNIDAYDVAFAVEKNIPTEAGLGGGSSDAAAALLALDRLYETKLSVDALCNLGVKLGADVPFCIRKGTVITEGIGEIMRPSAPMPDSAILLAMPKGGKVSTAEAYRKIDAIGADADILFADFLTAMENGDVREIAAKLYNKFELVTPEETGSLALIRKMLACSPLGARMSGSGASVFAVFTNESDAKKAFSALPEDMWKCICRPISSDFSYFI